MLTFIVGVQPLIISIEDNQIVYNYPIETKTDTLPYSSYVKIPDYWYQATDWINSRPGDGKVLLTPIDDFYEMPYNWTDGYYGTDQLVESLIDKPIISTNILSGYKVNNDAAATLFELGYAIRSGRVDEFRDFLDLLGVEYILQRNDIKNTIADESAFRYNLNNTIAIRNTLQDGSKISEGSIASYLYMKNFFENQSYLHLVTPPPGKDFGNLDIYEYAESKPSIFVSSPSYTQYSSIAIQHNITLQTEWKFNNTTSLNGWSAYRNESTANVSPIELKANYASSEITGPPSVWGIIESPSVPAQYRSIYTINSTGYKDGSIYNIHERVVQYGQDGEVLNTTLVVEDATLTNTSSDLPGNWGWTVNLKFEPLNITKFFKIQIWFDINPQLQYNEYTGNLGINDCAISQDLPFLDTSGFDNLFNKTAQSQIATISVQNINPTKIIATVNATKPFVLATSYVLDNSWVAIVNDQQIKPSPLFLGFVGFQINQTGQFDVTLDYKPQSWFTYASAISIASVGVIICNLSLCQQRQHSKHFQENWQAKE